MHPLVLKARGVLGSTRRSIWRGIRKFEASIIERAPQNPLLWIDYANENFSRLSERTQNLIHHHELTQSSHAINFFRADIQKGAAEKLKSLARNVTPDAASEAIEEIVRWLTISQCAHAHRTGLYFEHAEEHMARQWNQIVWPIIHGENFTATLELACGHGRNTEFLRRYAKSIDLVDVNQVCVDACKSRFKHEMDGCIFRYHVTSGNVLPVENESISFGYSWDSMVHFDKLVVRDYVREFARVLKPGGTAFLHHSNYGAVAPDSSWTKNHGNRSDMTATLMREYALQNGLNIKFQRLSGTADGWSIEDLDCLSLIEKPAI